MLGSSFTLIRESEIVSRVRDVRNREFSQVPRESFLTLAENSATKQKLSVNLFCPKL